MAACLIPLSVVAASAAEGPDQVVIAITDAVIGILKDPALSNGQKTEAIETVVYANVDFDTLSRLVVARNWRSFTPEQRSAFQAEFKKHLSVTYSRNIDNYRNEKVQVIGQREEPRGDRTVQTRILRGDGSAANISVDYRLRERNGQWKIIDVIVEGISLVANFRSQFQDILSGGSPDKLITLLREKNAKGESVITPVVPEEKR